MVYLTINHDYQSRTSGEYRTDVFFCCSIAPSSQDLEPSEISARFCLKNFVLFAEAERREDIALGCSVEFKIKVSRLRGSDYAAVVNASNFDVF